MAGIWKSCNRKSLLQKIDLIYISTDVLVRVNDGGGGGEKKKEKLKWKQIDYVSKILLSMWCTEMIRLLTACKSA